MSTLVPLLAHGGAGASWQALVVLLALGLGIVFLLVVAGRIPLETGNDLILPLATVAIVASIAPMFAETLSDFIGWAIPAGGVVLLGLILAAVSPLRLTVTAPLTLVVVVLAVVFGVTFQQDLTLALHPADELLPAADDASVTITQPQEGATVTGDTVTVTVQLEGATVGPAGLEETPDDPEELGRIRLLLDGFPVEVEPQQTCTVDDPCTELTYEVPVELPGQHSLVAEYVAASGRPLAPAVFDQVTFTLERP